MTSPAPPRARGRPREFDLDALLDRAIAVFSERGYEGTSLQDLTAATGVTTGSLYKAFPDKRALFDAAFDRYLAHNTAALEHQVARARTGRDQVRAVLTVYAEWSHDDVGRRGCLIVGTAAHVAESDGAVAARVAETFAAREALLIALVEAGQADGSIAPRVEPAGAARTLLCFTQGMRVVGKTGRTRDEMLGVVDSALKVLD